MLRSQIVNVNGDDPVIFPFSIKASKCSGSCNNINNPYDMDCKNLNVKVFKLLSRTNKTRHIEWHETCKCESRLDASFVIINNAGMMINAGMNVKK